MCDIFRRESADLRLTGSVSLALTHRPLLASYTEAAEDRLGERARFGKCAGRARNSDSAVQSLPRRPLRRAPRRALPRGAGRAGRASAPCPWCRTSRASRGRRTASARGPADSTFLSALRTSSAFVHLLSGAFDDPFGLTDQIDPDLLGPLGGHPLRLVPKRLELTLREAHLVHSVDLL